MDYGSTIEALMDERDALSEKLSLLSTTIDALQALSNGGGPKTEKGVGALLAAKPKKTYEWNPSFQVRKAVLDVLRAWDSATLKDIAAHSRLSHGSVTKVVKVLETEGVVARRAERNEHNAYEYFLVTPSA